MSQQGLLQQSIRDITGTDLDYNGDWLALMASDSITTGSFNERLLAWINVTLGTSYTNLPEAQHAFAVDQGYTSWSHMGAIVLATSGAIELLGSETQGLALDFTDDYYQADTGHYGSAYVLDTGTPANDYDSHPYGLLTYTSPSAKMTLGPSGTLRFGAHNLYVNSASPANQSITVVSGATYCVDITGSVSVTASGAATGTWTAGSNTFTAATTTLTLGSTSGSGTVVCRRTPSDSTYLATAGAARYGLPFEWDSAGNPLGILVEEARTNLCLRSEAFDNAFWLADQLSVAANAVSSPTGETTAETLTESTATAVHQIRPNSGITTGGVSGTASVFLKAGTCAFASFGLWNGSDYNTVIVNLSTGAITQTNGTVTSSRIQDYGNGWYRVSVTAAAGNPTYLSICTSDSATPGTLVNNRPNFAGTSRTMHVWGAQYEDGATFATSYCPTISATASRAADSGLTLATSAFPHSATVNSAMIRYRPLNVAAAMVALRWDDGTSNEVVSLGHSAAAALGLTVTDGGAAQTAPLTDGTAAASTWEKIACSWKANDFLFSDNGAAAVADTSGTLPTVTSLDIGPTLSGHISQILVVPVEKTGAEVATMATP